MLTAIIWLGVGFIVGRVYQGVKDEMAPPQYMHGE